LRRPSRLTQMTAGAIVDVLGPVSESEFNVLTSDAEAALRESEERFRGAFEAAAIGFTLVELDGRFRAVNASLCDMLGYSEPEMVAFSIQDITHPDDLAADNALKQRLLTGQITRYRLKERCFHKQGHVVWILLAVSLVRDATGQPAYYVGQATDITATKEAERVLARYAAELERSNTELEQFACVASHDLQQPLRIVASYAQLLEDRYRGSLDERADRWIGYIVSGVGRMQQLIDDLLAVARVHTHGGVFKPVDTDALITRTWRRVRPSHQESEFQLIQESLPTVVADPVQLEQLFQNLLGNAVKYRRTDRPCRVHVRAERHALAERSEWEFSIRDNGIGLDMVHADRIFEIFQRLHHEDEYEGTGIGLAICRRIVERHGGRIWVDSVPGDGSAFRFTLVEQAS
jgi:PAS domain S-box-containing protein